MRMTYDVAVIGGGPAGAVFAKELALGNPSLKILLVDAQNEGRRKVCGGLLAPDAQKVLAKQGLTLPKSVLADPQIFAVETIDLTSRDVKYYQRHYLNMDRYAFDKWLISLIPDGVDIVNGLCKAVVREGDGSFKLNIAIEGTDKEFFALSLVGADGANSIVRRSFFGKSIFHYIAIQQWFESDGGKVPYYSCIFDEKTSDSCSWTIHKGNYVVFGGAFRREGCREAFAEQKSRLEAFLGNSFGEVKKTEACLVSSPRRMRDFKTGEGSVFLLGEAAGFISPSSFEGLSCAMYSGKLLADAFAKCASHEKVQKLYRKETRSLRLKLRIKSVKRAILCNPFTRKIIMKSGLQSISPYAKNK